MRRWAGFVLAHRKWVVLFWYLPAGLARILRVQPSHAITPKPELGAVPIGAMGGKRTP